MADTQLLQSGAQVQADLNLTENLQDAFSTSSTYAVDDIVIYDSKLYKCTTAVSTAGAWDSSKWTQIHLSDLGAGGGGGGTLTTYSLTLLSGCSNTIYWYIYNNQIHCGQTGRIIEDTELSNVLFFGNSDTPSININTYNIGNGIYLLTDNATYNAGGSN